MSIRSPKALLNSGCLLLVISMPLAGIVSWVQPAEAAQAPAGVAGCDQSPVMPSPPAGAKVVSRDGTSDDTSAIQSAINGLHPGDWLVFPPGTYSISKHLTVPANGVTLYGKGATIHSINQADGAIMIEGDNTAVYGFTLTQDSTGRQTTPWAGGISLWDGRVQGKRRIQGLVLQGNTINNTTGGIFLNKVTNFTEPTIEESCYYFCEEYQVNANVDHYTSNAGGVNAGIGLTYKFSQFSNERFYVEARYVLMLNQQRYGVTSASSTTTLNNYTGTDFYPANSNRTTYIPIKFGLRF